MPIVRRDDVRDPLAPQILLLWERKWFILGVAVIAAVLTYIALLFVGSSYKVNAEIFVNRLPSVPEGETPNPDTVSSLLKSQSVIERVRNDYVKKFDVEAPKIEKFIKSFSVDSTVLQDTTVRKEISPVLKLEVEAQGAEETRFIMESWVRNFIEEFGNYTVEEAVVKRDAYMAEMKRIEQQLLEATRQQIATEARLPFIRKVFAEKLDQLSPARLRTAATEETEANVVQFIVQPPRMAPGLLERYSELKLQEKMGTLPTTGSGEMRALVASIEDVKTSVSAIQEEYAQTLTESTRLTREVGMLLDTRKAINEAITRFTVASAVFRQSSVDGLPAGGDIRALSMPVLPEARVWPKRSIAAVVAAVVAGILATFYVLAQRYIRNLKVAGIGTGDVS